MLFQKPINIRTYTVLSLGLLSWIYVFTKALNTPFTVDEASTYLDFVLFNTFLPGLSKWEANNHLINSLLTILSSAAFGDRPFALRLPNVLSFGLLIYQVMIFAKKRLHYTSSAVAISLLLFYSTLVLDFFSLCRGYGISLAFLMWFINEFLATLEKEKPSYFKVVLFGCFMVGANLNLLPLFMGALILSVAFQARSGKWSPTPTVLWGLSAIPFVIYGFLLKQKGLLYYGTDKFIDFTLGHTTALYVGSHALYWYFLPVLISIIIFHLSDKTVRFSLNKSSAMFLLFLLAFLAPIAQHILLGSPLPQDRTYMHVLMLSALVFVYYADRKSRIIAQLAMAYSLIIIAGFFSSFKIDRSLVWPKDIIPKGVIVELKRFTDENDKSPIVVSDYRNPSVWEYLNSINQSAYTYFRLGNEESSLVSSADYLMLSEDSELNFNPTDFDTIVAEARSDYALLRNKVKRSAEVDTVYEIGQNGLYSDPFFILFQGDFNADSSVIRAVDIETQMRLPNVGGDFQLVISQESEGENRRDVINLYRYYTSEQISGSKPFRIRIPINTKVNNNVSIYYWNVHQLSVHLEKSIVKVETSPIR